MPTDHFELPPWCLYGCGDPVGLEDECLIFQYGKDVTGRFSQVDRRAHAVISCFADNEIAKLHPEWIPVAGDRRATRQNKTEYFYCDWLCPSIPSVRGNALHIVDDILHSGVAGIQLDSVHFPHAAFCECADCRRGIASVGGDEEKWKCNVVSDFVGMVSCRLQETPLSITLYPDPMHPGRFGLDPGLLEDYVDFFVIPLYDLNYGSKYWIEILLNAFRSMLTKPFVALLYAKNVPAGNLQSAVELCRYYSPSIGFAYDAEVARKIISAWS